MSAHQLDDTMEVSTMSVRDKVLPSSCLDCYSCQVEYYEVNCINPRNPLQRNELHQFPTRRLLMKFNSTAYYFLPNIPRPDWCPRTK